MNIQSYLGKGLSNSALKYLACLFMVIDHGTLLLIPPSSPWYLIGRGLGRLAAPIFFWAISEGAFYTRRPKIYFRNLLLFGLGFHLFYTFFVDGTLTFNSFIFGYKNIFFTLAFGLLLILIVRKNYSNKGINYGKWLALLFLPWLGEYLSVDYGAYGILMIFLFYQFRGEKINLVVSILILNLLALAYGAIIPLQLLSLLALPMIFVYNNKRGKGNKYFFYIFYPLHLILLYGLKALILG